MLNNDIGKFRRSSMPSIRCPNFAQFSRSYASRVERGEGDEYPIGDEKHSLYPGTRNQLRHSHSKSMSYQLDFASMMR